MRTTLPWASFGLLWGYALGCAAAEPATAPLPAVTFPLEIAIYDPDAKEKVPPYIVLFDEGLDEKGRDVSGPLGRLEALRGDSKLFPESNKNPGLTVVLRGLRFHEQRDSAGKLLGYEVELLGEFNAIKVPVATEAVEKLINGQLATLELAGKQNFFVIDYVSTVKLDLQRVGKEFRLLQASGDFNFREGLRRYTSKTKTITPPAGRNYLYRGEQAELPKLNVL